MNFDTLRQKYPGYSDDEILQGLQATRYPEYSLDEIKSAIGYKPRTRNVAAVANDLVIEAANAAAGGVSSAANFVSPGNRVSRFIDENVIRPGEEKQSDFAKDAKARMRSSIDQAQGVGDELAAVGRYALDAPGLALAQAAGSFAGPGLAVKSGGLLAQAARLGPQGVARAGMAGGAAAGAAMSGGDAAQTAYELVIKAGGTEEQAQSAAREASVIPAVIGASGGFVGAERVLAGAAGHGGGAVKRALVTGLGEAAQEGIEEGATQYEGQRAAAKYDPTIDPTKGVAAAAGLGAVLGGATGAAVSLISPHEAQRADATRRLAEAGSVDEAIKAAQDLSSPPSILQRATMTAGQEAAAMGAMETQAANDLADLRQQGRMDRRSGLPPQAPQPERKGSAEFVDSPLADRILTVREQLADENVRGAVRALRPELLDEAMYYVGQADNASGIPEATRERMLGVAEAIIQRATLQPISQPGAVGSREFAAPDQIGANAAPAQIGLDTGSTGNIRVNSAGSAAPETRADAISTAQRVAQMRERNQGGPGMSEQTPRDKIRGSGPGVMVGDGTLTTPERPARPVRATPLLENAPGANDGRQQPDLLGTPGVAARPADGGSDQPRGSSGDMGQLAADAVGRNAQPADAPGRSGEPAVAVEDGGAADETLSDLNRQWQEAAKRGDSMAARAINERIVALKARTLKREAIDAAAREAATSPKNDRPEPTDAQKEAGNYKKGHVRISGLDVTIENDKGSVRRSKADSPQKWEVQMPYHYGYIKGTTGADGDHVDIGIGPKGENGRFWIINQHHAGKPDKFDEHKVFTGVDSAEEAVALYKRGFADNFGDKVFSSVSGELSPEAMKARLPELKKATPVPSADASAKPLPEASEKPSLRERVERTRKKAEAPAPQPEVNAAPAAEPVAEAPATVMGQTDEQRRAAIDAETMEDRPNAPEVAQPIKGKRVKVFARTLNGVNEIVAHLYEIPNYKGPQLAVKEYKTSRGQGYRVYLPKSGAFITDSNGVSSLEDTLKLAVLRIQNARQTIAAKTNSGAKPPLAERVERTRKKPAAEAAPENSPAPRRDVRAEFLGSYETPQQAGSARAALETVVTWKNGLKGPLGDFIKDEFDKGARVVLSGSGFAFVHKDMRGWAKGDIGAYGMEYASWLSAQESAGGALHKDPGEPAEPATPSVVKEAIRTAARNDGRPIKDVKAEAFANMVDDGDIQAALDYAESVGIDPKTAKLSDMLRKRLDKWMADNKDRAPEPEPEAAPAPAPAAEKPKADRPTAKGPATAQAAIDAFNADDSAQAMSIVAKLRLDDLKTVGNAIGFPVNFTETATAYRQRLAGVADRLTKTNREQMARERVLFDKLTDRAAHFDRMKEHAERAERLDREPDSPAFETAYYPMNGGDSKWMKIPEALKLLAADVRSLKDNPDYQKVSEMVRKARPAVFDAADAAPAAAPQQPEKAEKPAKPVTVEDFGQKLEGARKDQAPSLSKEYSDDDLAREPFSKVWPASEIDAIEDKFAAAVAHAARAEVPAKPRTTYKIDRWIEKVKGVRSLAQRIVSGQVTRERMLKELADRYALRDFGAKVRLLEQIDREQWGRIGEVSEAPDAYRYEGDSIINPKKIATPMVRVQIDGKTRWLEGSGAVEDHVDAVRMLLGNDAAEKRMQFEIRNAVREGNYFINKAGDKDRRRLKTFDKVEDARAFIKDHYDELVAEWEAVKSRDNVREQDVRGETNRPRTAEDWRKGKDVTPEQFSEAFGFRGVQFGNWVEQGKGGKDRQGMLNQAYDALMDLAAIVNVPPKALSLNGSLGLAFGARGSGSASAHYEPDTLVINLTKTRGAGTLAHEWFHALDNYFSHQRGGAVPMARGMSQDEYRQANYITYRPEPLMVRKDGRGTPTLAAKLSQMREANPSSKWLAEDQWQPDAKHPNGVRPEVERRFAALVEALDASPMAQRVRVIDKSPNGYWSRVIERAARSFENYVISKMMEKGYHNDYLANVREVSDFPRAKERYPYLLPEEVAPIATAFDDLFSTIKTRDTDRGTEMFSLADRVDAMRQRADTGSREQASQRHQDLAAELQRRLQDRFPGALFHAVPAERGSTGGPDGSGVSQASREQAAVATVAKRIFGHEVVFVRFDGDKPLFNGAVSDEIPGVVFINADAQRPMMAVLGHELVHSMSGSQKTLYKLLERRLSALLKNEAQYIDLLNLKYTPEQQKGLKYGEELIADVVGDFFTEPKFWQDMAADQPSLFKRVAQAIVRFLDDVIGKLTKARPFGTEQYLSDIEAARAAVVDSMRQFSDAKVSASGAQSDGINLSIADDDASKIRTAQDLINAKGGVFDFNRLGATKQDRVRSVMDGSRPFWLGALTRDQIADIYGNEIPPVKEYDALTRAMENERQKMAQDADDLYNEWAKLDPAVNDKLARIMLDATVYQVHPDAEFSPKVAGPDSRGQALSADEIERKKVHARISTAFKLLPKDAQAMYAKVKAYHEDTLTSLKNSLEGRIQRQVEDGKARAAALTNIRKMFDQYLKSGPYFPLSRFGDFIVVGTRPDGQRVVATYETAGEQQAAARELQKDGFTVKLKTSKTYSREMDGSAGKFIGDVLSTVGNLDFAEASLGGDAVRLKEKMLDDLNQMFIRALPDLSYRKHFLHRKNTPGFSSDVMRGFASSAFHAASHIARLNHGDQMTFALQDAYQQIENADDGDFNLHTQVLNELSKRHDAMLNPNTHPIASMLNSVGFVMYLGMSPAAGLVNMLQTVMVTMPHLGARYGFGAANVSLAAALKDITAAKANTKNGWNAAQSPKLSADERAMMTELQDEGVIDLTQAHDLASATGIDTGNVARSKAAFAMSRAMKIVGWTFHIPEVMNRQVTALSAFRLEMAKSNDRAKAMDAAREAIKRTHFDYSASNRARLMQGNLARVVTQFKQYSQNMTYLLGRAAYQALKAEDPEVRSIARRQLVATMGVTWAMAGALGLPGIGNVMALIGAMVGAMDDDDKPWDWKAEFRNLMADTFGKEAGEVLSHGIPRALMPWDIAGRVGMGDLWWRSNDREGQNPREAFANDMQNILGPTAGSVLGLYTAADHMARGDWGKAAESMVPKFIRDPLKALREGSEGVTSYTGEPLMDLTGMETAGRLLGFSPARASEMFEARNAVKNAETAITEKRQRLLSQVVKARLDKDAETARELMAEIQAFNRRNPAFQISGETITKSLLKKMKNRAATKDGIMLAPKREGLRELGRFAALEE